MYIPDSLYYEPKQLRVKYTDQFTGNLDFSKAQNQDPHCWKKEDVASQKQKKTLVLSDFRLEKLSDGEITELKKTLAYLLAEGFSIFLWQENDLTALNLTNLGLLRLDYVKQKCTPAHPHQITSFIAQKGISHEALAILDINNLSHLREEIKAGKPIAHATTAIDIQDVIKSSFSWKEIQSSLKSNSQFKCDYGAVANDKIKKFINKKNVPVSINYEKFHLKTAEDLTHFFEHAHEIKHLIIKGDVNVTLQELLDNGSNIEILEINKLSDNFNLSIKPAQYPRIKNLYIRPHVMYDFSSEALINLIQPVLLALPNIQSVNIPNLNFYGDINSFFITHKDFFEKIKYTFHVGTIKLGTPSKEEILAIEKCLSFDEMALVPTEGSSFYLVDFSLNNKKKQIVKVRVRVPNLEDPIFLSNEKPMINLEGVHISSFERNFNFTRLKQFAPNISSLNLTNNEGDFELKAEEINTFKNLTCLRIQSYNALTVPKIFRDLVQLQQLKEFYLSVDALFLTDSLLDSIKNVQKIEVYSKSSLPLGKILTSLSQSASIKLRAPINWVDFNSQLSLLPDRFKLRTIDLDAFQQKSDISSDFCEVLKRSPKLQKLFLSEFTNIDTLIKRLEGTQLENLKTIKFENCDLTIEGYQALRKIAPNLESATIVGCPASTALKIMPDDIIKLKASGLRQSYSTPGANSNRLTHSIDASTDLNEQTYNITKVFYDIHGQSDPHPREYRISAFNQLAFAKSREKPFQLFNQGDPLFSPFQGFTYGLAELETAIKNARDKKSTAFRGTHRMKISNVFEPIPSLESYEVLKSLHVAGLAREEMEVVYSARDSLYYIRKKTPGTLYTNIDFLVDVTNKPEIKPHPIQRLAENIETFHEGKLDLPDDCFGEDVLKAMYTQRLGKCDQRAAMFKYYAKRHFKIDDVRIMDNDCHQFVEVPQGDHWIKYDLGGYPANVNIIEPERVKEQISPQILKIDEPPNLILSALNQVIVDSATGERLGQNVLLECEDDASCENTLLSLQHTAKHTGHEIFVIDSPEQITCAMTWLKRNLKDNTGSVEPGPGGPLYEFLTQDFKGKKPVLLVNWNNFSADELVRFNSIIGDPRQADNTSLPKEMVVVGVYNTKKPDAYKGSDFHSRNPVKKKIPAQAPPPVEIQIPTPEVRPEEVIEIELYHSANWKELLLGRWTVTAGKFIFAEGPLAKAIKSEKSVHLKNAPWHLSDFQRFWQEAKIHGKIATQNETLVLSKSFWPQLTQGSGYAWQELTQNVHFETDVQQLKARFMLNPETFNQFIDHYIIENKLPITHPSLFKEYKNKTVQIVLTHPISDGAWAQLLKEAQKYNVTLQMGVPPEIALPFTIPRLRNKLHSKATIIETDDVSFTLKQMRAELPKSSLVVDVSELTEADILYAVKADFSDKNLRFYEKFSDVWKMLESGMTVVLKGHFSQSLKDHLTSLCLGKLWANSRMRPFRGNLILLSDDSFSPAFETVKKTPHLEEKLDLILTQYPALHEAILNHAWPTDISYAQIEASIQHASFDISEGIVKITKPAAKTKIFDLSPENVEKVCAQFVQKRLDGIKNILSYAPFVFIAGQTGVGKSTFVEKYMTPEQGFKLYHEMNQLRAWAKDRTPGIRKVLFFDEATVSDKNYTMFEGLYEIPPFVILDGEYIELTVDHVVCLASNPMSYGGERQIPTLLAEHGNAYTFDIMPPEYIFQEVLKPVFNSAQYSKMILNTYLFIAGLSKDENEILISPRELKMMAQMCVACPATPPEDIVYSVAHQCLPKQHQPAFKAWFSQQHPHFKEEISAPEIPRSTHEKPFILTPSRSPIYDSLVRLLKVRETGQTPGLGGMLLEGESGTGKSHFLMDALIHLGYSRFNPPKQFYYMPASLPFDEKKRILLSAFDQGVIVVTDELNSGPMMEQLLNSLLMGKHPDTKQGPQNPGFLLLATQNPIWMAGRQATSQAAQRRLLFHEFPAYTPPEMKMILQKSFPGLPNTMIDDHIEKHIQEVRYAKAAHIEPAPVFRDLYKLVEKEAAATLKPKSPQLKLPEPQSDIKSQSILPVYQLGREKNIEAAKKIELHKPRKIIKH